MPSRLIVHGLLASLLVGGFAVVADAIVVTDEERLGQLADELTDGPAPERVPGVLRWMDLSRESVRLEHDRRVRVFGDDDGHRLADEVFAALEPFAADDLEVVQRSVQVDGDRGTVAVRARADGALHDATFRLVRSGQGWLVGSVQAR